MRADLCALTAATLAELTNRGLVKRAARELERAMPELTEDDNGTVRAVHPDGVTTALPVGGLELGTCSCGAAGVCRHMVAVVLAYQSFGAAAVVEDEPEVWSPGTFTDDQVTARIGERAVAAARRVEASGYVARVHRPGAGDPVPSVELPTATVRFLVPDDLAFARTDAVAGVRDDVIALAVWAFRVADRRAPDEADVQVQVGGSAAPTGGPGLDSAVALAGLVLREGAVHLGAGLAADVAVVRRDLESARMRWPLLAVEDLVAQLHAYGHRSARYRPEALADHIAELVARHRAVTGGGPSLRSRVLGTDEASETPLRRARLDGLGARVSAVGDEKVVDLFLAHADSATVLVLRREYETPDTGPQLAARRVAGVTVGALAGGAVVTESAARSASRTVRLGTRRLSRTEAMATRGSWQDLPRTLIAADLTALAAELDALPPRPIRARVEAELVRVIPVAEVRSISYAPGGQRLDAMIADASGTTAVISATHVSCVPGRLDAMAAALEGSVRYVSGSVRRSGGGVVIDPIGFALDGRVVVPDLAPAARGVMAPGAAAVQDPIGQALHDALSLLAEVAHRGLQHLPSTMGGRLRGAAGRLGA
ncbi:SWIM zinc finger family protein, partial [Actinoplanes sp. TFC3]|uniref:SWIM zinc finger family protein n=1 Tax=Actinoplanes sp. TFC3 TaxID=1710355 RepID=UPI0008360ABA